MAKFQHALNPQRSIFSIPSMKNGTVTSPPQAKCPCQTSPYEGVCSLKRRWTASRSVALEWKNYQFYTTGGWFVPNAMFSVMLDSINAPKTSRQFDNLFSGSQAIWCNENCWALFNAFRWWHIEYWVSIVFLMKALVRQSPLGPWRLVVCILNQAHSQHSLATFFGIYFHWKIAGPGPFLGCRAPFCLQLSKHVETMSL